MEYRVTLRNSALKSLSKMPQDIQQRFEVLAEVLRVNGPTGPHAWIHYGKLKGQKNKFHCHLSSSHGYVACWEYQKNRITIEVYYVGSRKDAPY